MTTSRGTSLSSPAWGVPAARFAAPAIAPRPVPRPAGAPGSIPAFRTHRSGGAAGAALLALGWILLWAYFVVGVAEQAAALRSTVERGGGSAAAAEPAEAPRPPVSARVLP